MKQEAHKDNNKGKSNRTSEKTDESEKTGSVFISWSEEQG